SGAAKYKPDPHTAPPPGNTVSEAAVGTVPPPDDFPCNSAGTVVPAERCFPPSAKIVNIAAPFATKRIHSYYNAPNPCRSTNRQRAQDTQHPTPAANGKRRVRNISTNNFYICRLIGEVYRTDTN